MLAIGIWRGSHIDMSMLRCAVVVPLLAMNDHHPYPCWLLSHMVMIPYQYVEAVAIAMIHEDETTCTILIPGGGEP